MRLFVWQYFRHMRTVGAIAPSSRFLAYRMSAPINFTAAKLIVELGAGTGSFTRALLRRRKAGTTLFLIEHNRVFYDNLVRQFRNEPKVIIEHGSAADITELLKKHNLPAEVDCIVSGLPFASLPAKESAAILMRAARHLREGGVFMTFQYTLLKKPLLDRYFSTVTATREWRNVPPAYVLRCDNQK